MEEIGQRSPESARPRWRYWKFVGVFLLITILAAGGFFIWGKYLSPEAKRERELQQNYEKATKALSAFEEAMRNDTYGGKTPEETLKIFIEALKKEDIELASKYFILETNANSPDYLTRKKWEGALMKAKQEERLMKIIDILSKAEPDPEAVIGLDYYVFSARDENEVVIADIDFQLNKQSGVWKIISL